MIVLQNADCQPRASNVHRHTFQEIDRAINSFLDNPRPNNRPSFHPLCHDKPGNLTIPIQDFAEIRKRCPSPMKKVPPVRSKTSVI
jgi:hypothetical protein